MGSSNRHNESERTSVETMPNGKCVVEPGPQPWSGFTQGREQVTEDLWRKWRGGRPMF